ncbi:hypothetical protein INT48_008497 [Thamnidium elegans]|uniref:COPII coat assembly protein SEC16 n=1 Tax=Thamnidium elegans TaxID=101142 RepID=A0A8H7SKW8_9FUNG|nr:hypothetical protein INT48_008497 [Thamnidium elegans]
MTSHKEEPNPSILFGDSAGDDPFSQMLQQTSTSEVPKQVDEKKVDSEKKTLADASGLFGSSTDNGNNNDLFFSQPVQAPLTSNASGASFFEQPVQANSGSFFDGAGQQAVNTQPGTANNSQQQATSLTQAFDPNTYSNYDYSQQPEQNNNNTTIATGNYDQQQQQVEYDPNQWIQFDPNLHYYYDEQGQVHYYDPNTNQEYDMSQYTYDEQGQTYDYQYDPQYAEYYAQQGYDPATYAAVSTEPTTAAAATYDAGVATEQTYDQTSYDPNAYAPVTEQTNGQDYYNPQSHAPVNNAVAEVPAQIQSEQTIDTQHYSSQQYEFQQNYAPADTTATISQPQDYNYQGYEATDLQYAPTTDNGFTAANQDYSQSDFFAEDLQQQQPVCTNNFDAPPMAPPKGKSVLPPPPADDKQDILPPPPKNATPPKQSVVNPPQEQQEEAVVPSGISAKMESYDAATTATAEDTKEQDDLNDLDDLIFGGSKKDDCDQQASDELDLLISGSSLDSSKGKTDAKEPVYNNPNQYDEAEETSLIKLEDTAVVLAEPEQQVPENDAKATSYQPQATESKQDQTDSQEAYSYEPQQQSEQTVDYSSYEPQQKQSEQTVDYSSYEPQQQHDQALNPSYEPQQQNEQTVDYSSYLPQQQQTEQAVDYSGYHPQQQQNDQTVNYSSYEPQQQQNDQTVDYSSYLPQQQQQTDQAVDYSGYLPNQQTVGYSSYEPQQATDYTPEATKQPEASVDYSAYRSQATEDASHSMYQPQQQVDEKPRHTERTIHSSYAPPQDAKPSQASEAMPNQALPPPPKRSVISPPSQRSMLDTPSSPLQRNMVATPPPRSVVSPPPRRNMISPSSAASAMHSFSQQRSNSITEPDRKQNGSPFAGYYSQHIERSATVPPPMTERIASPRPMLTACPDPECEGENKAKAKFCCECGRPLAGISRSTTPSASLSPGVFSTHDAFSPVVPVTSVLDQKKENMMTSLKRFIEYSVIVQSENQDKQKLALEYIESRVPEFEESKALLWNIVKLMIQYQDHTLGDGGELDKSITKLLCTQSNEQTHLSLDKLEEFLIQGDRDGACQFAAENDMWAHALIISQSQDSEAFKRVMAQFIDRELFSTGDDELKVQVPGDKKSLRMLYSVFSGAGADAVMELARNSVDEHPTVCTKESLQDWKKALGLVLRNRSSNDLESIKALGDQLKKTDSLQDAYICYMLSPDTFKSLESQIIAAEGVDMYMNLDALYLTELYEFGLSKNIILNQYKLILAWWLSQFGFTHESQVYRDMIAKHISSDELQQLKKIGEICNTSTNSDVTSLLNKESFDMLIGSIEENVSVNQTVPIYQGTSSFDSNGITHAGKEAHDTLQGENYNYGYNYGGGYTESADNNKATAVATTTPFGIQSPFQNNAPHVQPISSPFAVGGGGGNGGVRSPFQHTGTYVPTAETTDTVEPYQLETPAVTSYQPDAYAPASQTDAQTTVLDDDEDDLGFGNSKPKPVKQTTKADGDDDTTAEKPNEVSSNNEEKKETKGGWGLFSLFGRKEKASTAEEKKAVRANLGEQSSFYYDEKEKRWVNKLNDSKPVAAATPPPPKAATPQPAMGSPTKSRWWCKKANAFSLR